MLKHELSGKAFHLHSNGPVDAGARTCDPDGCPYTFRSWGWYAAYMPHWASQRDQNGRKVIVDTRELTPDDKAAAKRTIHDAGLSGQVVYYPD